MTKHVSFTQADIKKTIAAAQAIGLVIKSMEFDPGTRRVILRILDEADIEVQTTGNDEGADWTDV